MTHILESQIKIEECTMPWRIVLHRHNGNLVTHCETLRDVENEKMRELEHDGYHHGHYHADTEEGRQLAVLDFAIRCKNGGIAPAI